MQCENLLRLRMWPYVRRCQGTASNVLPVKATAEEVALCEDCVALYVDGKPISYHPKRKL